MSCFRGIVPITCDELFKIIEKGDGSVVSFIFLFLMRKLMCVACVHHYQVE